jgi:hypothetical protein
MTAQRAGVRKVPAQRHTTASRARNSKAAGGSTATALPCPPYVPRMQSQHRAGIEPAAWRARLVRPGEHRLRLSAQKLTFSYVVRPTTVVHASTCARRRGAPINREAIQNLNLNLVRFRRSPAAAAQRAFPKPQPCLQVAFYIAGLSHRPPCHGTQRRAVRTPKLTAWGRPNSPVHHTITTPDRGQHRQAAGAIAVSPDTTSARFSRASNTDKLMQANCSVAGLDLN